MIKAKLDRHLDPWLKTLFPFLFRRPLNPNLLSALGVGLSVAAGVAFALGAFVWGGVLVLLSGFFDLVDGAVARHHGTATTFGAFLDSTLDRLADMAVLLGIVMYYARAGDPGLVLLAGTALVSSVLVSYARARAEVVVARLKEGVFERGERVALIAVGAVTGTLQIALAVVALGAAATVVQRVANAHREMARLDAAAGEEVGEHP